MKKPDITSMAKRVTAALALPEEVVLNLPLVTIVGSNELTVENHKGIIEYTEERLRVGTTAGVLLLCGKRLCIRQLTAERMQIRGAIDRIEFMR